MKKNLSVIIVIIFMLSPLFTLAKSKYSYKKYDSQTIGVDLNILRRTLVSNDGIMHQKFLDVGYRFSYTKSINKQVSVNLSGMATLDQYSLFKTNTDATENYFHIHNNKLISLSTEYNYMLGEYLSIHPRIGMGMMYYEQSHKNEVGEEINAKKNDQLLMLGVQGKIHITENIALGGSFDYMYSLDAIKSTDDNHAYLNAPMLSGGLFYTFSKSNRKNYCIRCPRF